MHVEQFCLHSILIFSSQAILRVRPLISNRKRKNFWADGDDIMISLYLNPYVCVWADRGRGAVCWLGKNKKEKKKYRGGNGKDKYEERWIINFLLWVVREKEGGGEYGRSKIQVHMIESMYNQI